MKAKILKDLLDLAIPIDSVELWGDNPHEGKVVAMMSILDSVGQHRPILIHGTPRESGVVRIGNTTWKAAKELGWTHIAAIWDDGEDETTSIARGILDNQVATLGRDNKDLLDGYIIETVDLFPDVFDDVGWDDFYIASVEEDTAFRDLSVQDGRGYTPPEIFDPPSQGSQQTAKLLSDVQKMDQSELVKTGVSSPEDNRKQLVQYTLYFDTSEQRDWWHHFIRYLKDDPEVSDEPTTAAKLISFLQARVEV